MNRKREYRCKCGLVFEKEHKLRNHIGYMYLRDGTEARDKHGRVRSEDEVEQMVAAWNSYRGY